MRHFELIRSYSAALLCLLISSWAYSGGPYQQELAELEAFGGSIQIPNYMYVVVQKRQESIVEIRLLRKLHMEGPIHSLIITRPAVEDSIEKTDLRLISKSEVNGFTIKLYEPTNDVWSVDLLAASITRCGEVGNVFFSSKSHLEEFLRNVPTVEC